MIEIKSVHGNILYTSSASSVRAAVEDAAKGADLRYADLRYADLGYADLRYADLGYADLRYADLGYADLGYADLGSADLRSANLGSADLRSADLGSANLGSADLGSADLRYADLRYADLRSANLRSAINADHAIAQTRILPDEGSVIGWKKAMDGRIVKLKIPAKAKRSHAAGRKCRADQAKVLAIFDRAGSKIQVVEAFSTHDSRFRYVPGETVVPTEPFDDDPWNECASGIHFFITRLEAENYGV